MERVLRVQREGRANDGREKAGHAECLALLLGRTSPVALSGNGHLEADSLGIEEFIESALPR